MAATAMRPVRFVGDSREVLRQLPDEVKSEIGFALERVQQGKMPVTPERYCVRRDGDYVRLQKECVQGRVYGEVPESSLRFARVPEEVQTGHRNAET